MILVDEKNITIRSTPFFKGMLPDLSGISISGKTDYKTLSLIIKRLRGYKSIKLTEYNIDFSTDKMDYTIRFFNMKESEKERASFSKKFNINVEALVGSR